MHARGSSHAAICALEPLCADPAAEHFNYPVSIDVRDLITLDDVADEFGLGPNG